MGQGVYVVSAMLAGALLLLCVNGLHRTLPGVRLWIAAPRECQGVVSRSAGQVGDSGAYLPS